MSLLDYVLDGQAEEAPSVAATPLGATASNRPSALAALYALLARLFSYPERRQAEDHTSIELLRQVRELLEGLGPRESLPVDVAMRFEAWAAKSPTARGRDLRAEFTRLFYGYPRLVPLTGSRWVTQGRTEFSLAHGERAAVGLEYRKLGLKNRPGNGDPFDALVSELDFLSYVTSLEARAFEGGDAGSAREWELLRLDFCAHHFGGSRAALPGPSRSTATMPSSPCTHGFSTSSPTESPRAGAPPSERCLGSGDGEFRVLPPALILSSSWPIGLSF